MRSTDKQKDSVNLIQDKWGLPEPSSGGGITASTTATITTTDHGALTGLSDDDHLIYLRADGVRPLTGNWDAGSFKITAQQLESDIATGTTPFIVASTTLVANLNADLWDGYQFADYFNQVLTTTASPTFNGLTVTSITIGANTLNTSEWAYLDGQNQSILTTSSPQFANLIITSGGDIKPSADSTTAINIAQADGTDFITFDTTNKKIGVGYTSPNAVFELHKNTTILSGFTADGMAVITSLTTEGDNRSGVFITERANTVASSSASFGMNAFAYHYGSADLTHSSRGLVGNRMLAYKRASGGTITWAIGASTGVGFTPSVTGTITNAADYFAEGITASTAGTIINAYGYYGQAHTNTITNAYSIWLQKQTAGGTINSGIVLDGDGVGSDIVLGDGQDVSFRYSGTQTELVNLVGTGVFDVQMDLSLTAQNIVTDTTTGMKIGTVGGASGQLLGFFGQTPIVQPVLATGAGNTVDNVITVLQNLGLVRQA